MRQPPPYRQPTPLPSGQWQRPGHHMAECRAADCDGVACSRDNKKSLLRASIRPSPSSHPRRVVCRLGGMTRSAARHRPPSAGTSSAWKLSASTPLACDGPPSSIPRIPAAIDRAISPTALRQSPRACQEPRAEDDSIPTLLSDAHPAPDVPGHSHDRCSSPKTPEGSAPRLSNGR
jgi:hypothetical protein